MKLTRDFLYTAKKPILLVCDYYETPHIPSEMLEVKDNIALFPIANIAIIEIILGNLQKQKLKNVIIAGTRIDNVVEHVMKTDFVKTMNIRVFKSKGTSVGDLFRELYANEFEFPNMLVMYANSFTNISLKELYKKHIRRERSLLTLFLHKKDSNDSKTCVYGTVGNRLIFYEESTGEKIDFSPVINKVHKEMSVCIDTSLASPRVMYVSKEIFSVFHSNFDYQTFGDLIIGTLAMGLWDDVFYLYKEKDFWEEQETAEDKFNICFYDVLLFVQPKDKFVYLNTENNACSDINLQKKAKNKRMKGNTLFYGKEITTLLDYYNFNMYVWTNPEIVNFNSEILKIKGMTGNNTVEICGSFVGEKALVEANIENCIVWDNCRVREETKHNICVTEKHFFDINYLETVNFIETTENSNSEDVKKSDTFFDDLKDYLLELITTAKLYNFGQAAIHKQISLLRILRNASNEEVVEAFAYFLIDIIDLNTLQESLSQASKIFYVLLYYIIQKSDQQLLLDVMLDCLSVHPHDIKVQIFFNYGYLFVQYKIIDKAVLKKYTNCYKAGKL